MMRRNPARMKYQKDKRSSALCVLAIAFNIYYFVAVFRSDAIAPDLVLGADVIVNIVFMMVAFLAGEKLKAYEPRWGWAVLAMGIAEIARVLVVPAHYRALGVMSDALYYQAAGALALAGLSLMAAGVNALVNRRLLDRAARTEG
ncbi:MAG TPA: hypothetical protein VN540_01550 [Clostridia bacterium]|nr:hypothetical protein [Clostridia bacterium]